MRANHPPGGHGHDGQGHKAPDVPAKAYVVHRSPGRVRLRVPEKRHDRSFFAELKKRLANCPSVNSVSTDPLTGSVLAHFDEEPGKDVAIMVEALEAGIGAFIDVELAPPPHHIADRARHHMSSLNDTVRDYSGGATDGSALVILALFLTCIWQIMRGQILAPAAQLLWYAMQISRAASREAQGPHHER